MKYKVYPVLFVIILLGFMSVFGGITDIEDSSDCEDKHASVTFGDSEMTSNGNEAIVKQFVTLNCEDADYDDCDSDCDYDQYSAYHYNDSVLVSVLQNGSIVQTVSAEIDYSPYVDSIGTIENTFNFVAPGDYVLRYTIVCDGGVVSTHDEQITITEGISGNFDLIGMTLECDETGNRFSFSRDNFTGTNAISIDNTSFNLQLNIAAEIDTVAYPCIESSYELNETGTFTTNGDKITISYVDGSATVSQTFNYEYDGRFLSFSYFEANEDKVVMFFEKQTVLAKR